VRTVSFGEGTHSLTYPAWPTFCHSQEEPRHVFCSLRRKLQAPRHAVAACTAWRQAAPACLGIAATPEPCPATRVAARTVWLGRSAMRLGSSAVRLLPKSCGWGVPPCGWGVPPCGCCLNRVVGEFRHAVGAFCHAVEAFCHAVEAFCRAVESLHHGRNPPSHAGRGLRASRRNCSTVRRNCSTLRWNRSTLRWNRPTVRWKQSTTGEIVFGARQKQPSRAGRHLFACPPIPPVPLGYPAAHRLCRIPRGQTLEPIAHPPGWNDSLGRFVGWKCWGSHAHPNGSSAVHPQFHA
jgi:hypothetical protein